MSVRATTYAALCALLLMGIAACFSLTPPAGVQITCSADNRWCPGELECCNNQRCLPPDQCEPPACPDGKEPCAIDDAIDCERGLICSGGCWADFRNYQVVCDDTHYLPCQLDGFPERWYCPQDQSCVVQMSGEAPDLNYRGECYQPPTQCDGIERHNCACLTAPFSTSPPCSPWQMCDDGFSGCVACREGLPNYNVLDASWGEDVRATPIGAGAGPECYAVLGTSTVGQTCCELYGTPAQWADDGSSYFCDSDHVFVASCGGYGDGCLNEQETDCGAADDCLWSWYGGAGLHCAADGPASYCLDGDSSCVSGSSLRSSCDCVASACPG